MSDYMNNGAPGNVVTQQGFVVSDAIRPEYTDEEFCDALTMYRNQDIKISIKAEMLLRLNYSAKSSVERYLSPVSGRRTTMFLPSFSGSIAALIAP